MNDDSTIGRSVALLAAGSCGHSEGIEPGVAGWELAYLVVERVRGWLADTDDSAIALLERLEADPDEPAIRALAQGIDLLLRPTSRIGRDLRSLIDQANDDEILAPLLAGVSTPTPTTPPAIRTDPSHSLFPPAREPKRSGLECNLFTIETTTDE